MSNPIQRKKPNEVVLLCLRCGKYPPKTLYSETCTACDKAARTACHAARRDRLKAEKAAAKLAQCATDTSATS